jgi:hypothetical protein
MTLALWDRRGIEQKCQAWQAVEQRAYRPVTSQDWSRCCTPDEESRLEVHAENRGWAAFWIVGCVVDTISLSLDTSLDGFRHEPES